jgi:RNA-directed DNA polymerase
VRHYIRYVDDFVLLHESPQQLNAWRAAIEAFLAARLGLKLNPPRPSCSRSSAASTSSATSSSPHRRTLRRRTLNGALRRLERHAAAPTSTPRPTATSASRARRRTAILAELLEERLERKPTRRPLLSLVERQG